MKILIASTIVPFIDGGGTFIVDWLDQKLKEYGHQSEVLKIPFHSDHRIMHEQMLALRLFDLGSNVDRLIAIRTPSYLIQHPNKFLWFIHHHRGAYDLWGTQYQDIPTTDEGLKIRESFIKADNLAFKESKKIFTNSKVVSQRLKKFNDVDSEVLYPPLLDINKYYCADYSDYIFYTSRITHHKRQLLAIEAMKHTKTEVKIIIAGNIESQEYLKEIEKMVLKNDLQRKVTIINRWISDKEKYEMYANSLGCIYIPFDEDSYGYPSLEAFQSEKAVVTCRDSGGTLEIVEDGVNGYICENNAQAIAESFDKLFNDREQTKKMGRRGKEKMHSMNISWDNVIRRFTE